MVKKIISLIVVFSFILVFNGCVNQNDNNIIDNNGSGNAAVVSKDAPIASVNGEVIYFQQVYEHMEIAAVGVPLTRFSEDEFEELKRSVVESLITSLVIRDFLWEEIGIEGLTLEVMAMAEEVAKRFSEDLWLNRLLRLEYISQQTFNDHIEFIQNSNWFLMLMNEERNVTQDEIIEYFKANREQMFREVVLTSHILLETYEEAEYILARINAGEDFGTLAEKYSLDHTSSHMGGMVFEFGRGEAQPAYEEAAFDMEIDEIRGPVETAVGFHIIRLDDRLRQEPHEGALIYIVTDILVRTHANERIRELRSAATIIYY